ncbi:MAG: EpsG family protein [Chlorobium sp.]|nr:MAG: hypothetical protein FDX17_06090 [Chlorobium sp.]
MLEKNNKLTYINKNKANEFHKRNYLLFIVWPFLSFINSVKQFKYLHSKILILLFLGLYGYTYIFIEGTDSISYAKSFINMSSTDITGFFSSIKSFQSEDSGSLDFVIPIIAFILSRFTDNPYILYAILSIIFGFYLILSVNIIFYFYNKNKSKNSLFFLLSFLTILPISNINGIRFWLATYIFFYASYFCVYLKKYNYILLSFFSAFIHFSYFPLNLLLLLFLIIGEKNIFYYFLLLLSFLFPEFIFNNINKILSYFSLGISSHVSSYVNDDYVQYVKESKNSLRFELQFIGYALYWYFIIATIYYLRLARNIKQSKSLRRLYSFIIFLLSFVNFFSVIPSGGRFKILFYLFANTYLSIINSGILSRRLFLINYIGVLIFILNFIIVLRQGSESLNIILFFPFTIILSYYNIHISLFNTIFRWFHL